MVYRRRILPRAPGFVKRVLRVPFGSAATVGCHPWLNAPPRRFPR